MRRAGLALIALLLPVTVVLGLPGGSPEKITVSPAPALPSGPSRATVTARPGGRPAVNAFALNDALRVVLQTNMDAALRWNARVELDRVEALRQRVSRSGPSGTADQRPAPASTFRSALPITGDYHTWPDWPLWRAVGLCEQGAEAGGPWDTHGDGIAWGGSPAGGLPGSGYPGGLGLGRPFWDQFAAAAGVTITNGAYASPDLQIRVARQGSHDGTRMGGWSSWPDCVQAHLH